MAADFFSKAVEVENDWLTDDAVGILCNVDHFSTFSKPANSASASLVGKVLGRAAIVITVASWSKPAGVLLLSYSSAASSAAFSGLRFLT
jgi:hypothetical protein